MVEKTANVKSIPKVQRRIAILWSSFLMASLATVLYFFVLRPLALPAAMGLDAIDHPALWGLVFLFCWLVAGCSSCLTCFFQKSCNEVNDALNRKMRA